MKILFISIPSIHAIRWMENLKNTNNELFWFDITNQGLIDTNQNITQYVNWKKRKLPHFKGEYKLSRKFPDTFNKIKHVFEITENEALEKIINEIQPDVIHSFEMQHCSYPIIKTMKKFPKIKWIYSCWGSDLYYYKDFKNHKKKIIEVLKRVNYLHTDCERDYKLALQLGFKGKHTGVIPGGTGYILEELQKFKLSISSQQKKIILVKGYEHQFGRGLNVVKALEQISDEIKNYEVVVFAAHSVVIKYIKQKNLPFLFFDRHGLKHDEVLKLMGKTLIYVGNSISDGIPNTLLEAIIMGAFPIQSNPGNVTQELINNTINGLLINNPESTFEIKNLIIDALSNKKRLIDAEKINSELAISRLDYKKNRDLVISIYNSID